MIIGIGGISRAGKSSLATNISNRQSEIWKSVQILEQDDYVLPEPEIPRIRDHINWEIPESIDWNRLIQHADQERRSTDLLIVEGLLVFSHPDLCRFFDLTIYVQLNQQTFFERKRKDLRWGSEPDWYIDYIWEAHQQYGLPRTPPDLRVDGSREIDVAEVLKLIENRYKILSSN